MALIYLIVTILFYTTKRVLDSVFISSNNSASSEFTAFMIDK